ncbi:MAG TPA: adenylate kinase [Planctomycetota bacterium]|nr:adenylate kinase [Planctomycetota bacterium]
MRLVFLGPPGAGKGTQAVRYAQEHKLPHVSTGDMLRAAVAAGSPAGKKAKPIMDAGGLVSDDIVLACVEERLDSDAKVGFILDGYPRNVQQATDLETVLGKRGMALDGCVNFELAIEAIVPRMAGRRSCPKDGSVYHVTGNPPKVAGKCDKCGGDLVQRADDKEEVVRERMKTYAQKTEPLIEHYRRKGLLINVDADGGVDQVYGRLCDALKGRSKVGAK